MPKKTKINQRTKKFVRNIENKFIFFKSLFNITIAYITRAFQKKFLGKERDQKNLFCVMKGVIAYISHFNAVRVNL